MTTETPTAHVPLSAGRRWRLGDVVLQGVAGLAALGLAALMVLLVIEVVDQAKPALQEFGAGFLTSSVWNTVKDTYGAADLIFGTLVDRLRGAAHRGARGDRDRALPERARSARAADAGGHDGRAARGHPERRPRPLGDSHPRAVPERARRAMDDCPSRVHPVPGWVPVAGRPVARVPHPDAHGGPDRGVDQPRALHERPRAISSTARWRSERPAGRWCAELRSRR